MLKFTKIVATISDLNCSTEFIRSLYDAGMNVVRINTAHSTPEGLTNIVNNTRAVADDIGIIIDTKGPEIRTTAIYEGNSITFTTGQQVEIIGNPEGKTDESKIFVNYSNIANEVKDGTHILIDDGELDFIVNEVKDGVIYAEATNDGTLGSRKSVNIPGVALSLASLSERDKNNLRLAASLGIDFVAHSFVRSGSDVKAVKKFLGEIGSSMKIISKIENQQGVDNFDEIVAESYGIMIARGDLGIEVSAEKIPALQKMMIRKCIDCHKPVIVATQMLHSMIENPRPTRAEVSDVAGAVEQRTDAIMLSGETAKGKYPVEAVRTMMRIAQAVEEATLPDPLKVPPMVDREVTSFLARQAVISEARLGTKAIISDTYTGRTARYVASFRGQIPTFAICYRPTTRRLLSLSYGIQTFDGQSVEGNEKKITETIRTILEGDHLNVDDLVAYLGGRPGEGNKTSFLEIDTIENIIKP